MLNTYTTKTNKVENQIMRKISLALVSAFLLSACDGSGFVDSNISNQPDNTDTQNFSVEEQSVQTSTTIIGSIEVFNDDIVYGAVTVTNRELNISTTMQSNGTYELTLPVNQVASIVSLDITGSEIVPKSISVPVPALADRVMVNASVTARTPAITFNLEAGGLLQNVDSRNRTSVSVPANAFVLPDGSMASGDAQVSITEIDITDLHGDSAWAPNLVGIAEGMSEPTAIWSHGMSDFHFSQNGQDLQLREGVNATINMDLQTTHIMPVGGELVDAAQGATIPMWHYDTDDMIWKEEGVSTVNIDPLSATGFSVSGDVSHFSTWNLDDVVPAIPATVEIVLVDLFGRVRDDITVTSYKTIARIPPSDGPGWHGATSYQNEELMTPENNTIIVLANRDTRAQKLIDQPDKYSGYTEMEIFVDDIMTNGYPDKINTESIMKRVRFTVTNLPDDDDISYNNPYTADNPHVVIEVLVADF